MLRTWSASARISFLTRVMALGTHDARFVCVAAGCRARVRMASPERGDDTEAVLTDLDLDTDEIKDRHERYVI